MLNYTIEPESNIQELSDFIQARNIFHMPKLTWIHGIALIKAILKLRFR